VTDLQAMTHCVVTVVSVQI